MKKRLLTVILASMVLTACSAAKEPARDSSTQGESAAVMPDASSDSTQATDGTVDNSDLTTIKVENLESLKAFDSGDITQCYCTDMFRGGNHYYIEDGVLYGTGNSSEYGQLGVEGSEAVNVTEPFKIADNVVHFDYSGEYFLTYLTGDHQLYGLGADVAGVFIHTVSDNGEISYKAVIEPVLLMENIEYAKCCETAIFALTSDHELYVFGNENITEPLTVKYSEPRLVDSGVKYLTAYSSCAYIKDDNSLWTFGKNSMGECGYGSLEQVSEPVKIADDISCAWMGFAGVNHTEIELGDKCFLIAKANSGSYMGCGESIGSSLITYSNDGIPEEVVASVSLEPVEIAQFSSLDVSCLSGDSSLEDVESLLQKENYQYAFSTNDDGTASNDIYTLDTLWTFQFDDNQKLVRIMNSRSDSFAKDSLTSGVSKKQVEETYGTDYVVEDNEHYTALVYDLSSCMLEVDFFEGVGVSDFCIRFS